jgi:hypothetical protein
MNQGVVTEMRPIRNSRVTLVMHMRVKTTRRRLTRLPENMVKYPDAVSVVRWKEPREALEVASCAGFSRSRKRWA